VARSGLDDMAERELAKRKSSNGPKYSATQKEFDELVKAIPDPAGEQDSLLADGTCCRGRCACCDARVQSPEFSQVPWWVCRHHGCRYNSGILLAGSARRGHRFDGRFVVGAGRVYRLGARAGRCSRPASPPLQALAFPFFACGDPVGLSSRLFPPRMHS
jgi:hypothetical protein